MPTGGGGGGRGALVTPLARLAARQGPKPAQWAIEAVEAGDDDTPLKPPTRIGFVQHRPSASPPEVPAHRSPPLASVREGGTRFVRESTTLHSARDATNLRSVKNAATRSPLPSGRDATTLNPSVREAANRSPLPSGREVFPSGRVATNRSPIPSGREGAIRSPLPAGTSVTSGTSGREGVMQSPLPLGREGVIRGTQGVLSAKPADGGEGWEVQEADAGPAGEAAPAPWRHATARGDGGAAGGAARRHTAAGGEGGAGGAAGSRSVSVSPPNPPCRDGARQKEDGEAHNLPIPLRSRARDLPVGRDGEGSAAVSSCLWECPLESREQRAGRKCA
ncbi:hypothetical protein T484DRAFT_1878756 [Baffinella frigidus]|nr:hypothetical protein T484DRAFT_1878756 [Cryptophyta sp. CCMP2293]